ncbi:MAG TPA: hypothetical protein VGC19_06180 [Rhodanobacter sp.]
MADVKRFVGAFEDVEGEFHFLASLPVDLLNCSSACPFDFAGCAATLRVNGEDIEMDMDFLTVRSERRPRGPKSKSLAATAYSTPRFI